MSALAAHKPVAPGLPIHDPELSAFGTVGAANAFRTAEPFPFDQVVASCVPPMNLGMELTN